MITYKPIQSLFMIVAVSLLTSSCWLFDEDKPGCGPQDEILSMLVDIDHPVTMENYVSQDGTWSYYEFVFPPEITDAELCVEEHCKLDAVLFFGLFYDEKIKNLKVEGLIELGFTGHPMTFTQNGTYYESNNDFGLKQTFQDESYGWIYGTIKISFLTFGTAEEEIAELNSKLEGIRVTLTYNKTAE